MTYRLVRPMCRLRDNYVFDYRWRVPEDHDQGSFWYHSHAHGEAEGQVLSGLSGMFMIDGFINDWYPWLNGAQERILILKDIELPGADDGDPKSKTINGQRNPTITMTRSQPQIWQIGNVGADAFFDLEVEGLEFWILARDGNPLTIPYTDTRLWLPPGARLTAFITSPRVGQFRLIMPFLEDRIAGRFVYHCHILEHEDGGMMANINVQPR